MIKKIIAVLLTVIAATGLFGCAKPAPVPEEPTAEPTEKPTVSMFDLAECMREAMPEGKTLVYASKSDSNAEDEFSYVSDIAYEKVEDFFILYAPEGKTSAAEIVVIAMASAGDAEAAADSLRRHVQNRIGLYSTYEPQFVPELENAVIFTEKQYAVLIVGGADGAPEKAFRDFIDN